MLYSVHHMSDESGWKVSAGSIWSCSIQPIIVVFHVFLHVCDDVTDMESYLVVLNCSAADKQSE